MQKCVAGEGICWELKCHSTKENTTTSELHDCQKTFRKKNPFQRVEFRGRVSAWVHTTPHPYTLNPGP